MAGITERASVDLNLSSMRKLATLVKRGLAADADPNNPLQKMFRQWAARFEAFTRRRFNLLSRGGGEWPALAKRTIAARRDGRRTKKAKQKPRVVSILVNTGLLRAALQIGAGGNILKRVQGGILYGIGNAKHGSDKATLGQIAIWQHTGAGHLPVRRIIVPPDSATRQGMMADAARAKAEMIRLASQP